MTLTIKVFDEDEEALTMIARNLRSLSGNTIFITINSQKEAHQD